MSRECLHCGESSAYVDSIRARDGYTVGCGIESHTEGGYDYEELSPKHRWVDWKDSELSRFGVKPEAFEKHRRTSSRSFQWISCEDTVRGHVIMDKDEPDYGVRAGGCMLCGAYPNRPDGES